MAALLLGGCASSPPTNFYTLSDTATQAAAPGVVGSVIITGVTIPGEIDRPEIVRRVGSNQLSVAGSDRWAAPLDDTIRRVLTDDIGRRMPGAAAQPQRSVAVDIREFYGDANCNVTLRAVWTLKQSGAQATTEEIQVPSSGSCPTTLAATMSLALGQLSDRIIAGVARIPPAAASR
jgi:uncharacterized lipoprotein YmbA